MYLIRVHCPFIYLTQIGCCGADGSHDYIRLRQPLPDTCRDSVTGNAFFNGCVDEFTWLLEDKAGWIAGLAMTLALIQVIPASMVNDSFSIYTRIHNFQLNFNRLSMPSSV